MLSTMTSTRAATSRNARFNPCPASGCTPCAASPNSAKRGRHIAAGKVQLERPGLPRAVERDGAQLAAEALLDLGEEARVIERQNACGLARLLGPRDARAVAGQRQDGERPGRQEVLHRAAAVRAVVAHGGDDAGLRVAPADDLDAGGIAQRRLAPVGGNDQRRGDLRARRRAQRARSPHRRRGPSPPPAPAW